MLKPVHARWNHSKKSQAINYVGYKVKCLIKLLVNVQLNESLKQALRNIILRLSRCSFCSFNHGFPPELAFHEGAPNFLQRNNFRGLMLASPAVLLVVRCGANRVKGMVTFGDVPPCSSRLHHSIELPYLRTQSWIGVPRFIHPNCFTA